MTNKDGRYTGSDFNLAIQEGEISPKSRQNIKSVGSIKNMTASRKSVLKKVHRKESMHDNGTIETNSKGNP